MQVAGALPRAGSDPIARPRIRELDGLRGVAILMVLLLHYFSYSPAKYSLTYYLMIPLNIAWSGVDLFFVLSGFLIAGILVENRDSPHYFSSFYLRRIHRIFPLYYGIVLCTCLGAWLLPSPLFIRAMPLWAYPLFIQNFVAFWVLTFGPAWISVTWSLAVEEQFYFVLPVIVRRLSRRAIAIFAVVCVFGAPLLRTAMIARGAVFEQVYPLFFCRVDALAFGVLAALIFRDPAAKAWLAARRKTFLLVYGLSAAACASMFKVATFPFVGTVGYTLMDDFYFLTILSVLLVPIRPLNRILIWKPLLWFGMVSYATYLFHEPALYTLFWIFFRDSQPAIHDSATLLVTLAALLTTLVCAQLSWIFIERPLIARAHRRYKY